MKISLAQYTNVNGKSRTEMERWVWICSSLRHLSVCNICLLCVWLSDSSLGFKALSRSSISTLVPVQFFYFQPVRQIQALTLKATDIAFRLSLFLLSHFCSVTTLSNLIFLSVFNGLKSGSHLSLLHLPFTSIPLVPWVCSPWLPSAHTLVLDSSALLGQPTGSSYKVPQEPISS